MFGLNPKDHRPLYEQIKERLKGLMIDGYLKQDEQLPSVRELAISLAINPNTIQKAYKDLETEGFIYSVRGKGSFVAKLNESNHFHTDTLVTQFSELVRELRYLNTNQDTLQEIIKNIYQEGTV